METAPAPATPPLEVVKTLYAAFERRDVPTIASLLSSKALICQSPKVPWGGTYEGLEGFARFFTLLTQHLDSKVKFERFIDAGEHIVAIGHTYGTVHANGCPFDAPIAHVWKIEGGKVAAFFPYLDIPTMQKSLRGEVKASG